MAERKSDDSADALNRISQQALHCTSNLSTSNQLRQIK